MDATEFPEEIRQAAEFLGRSRYAVALVGAGLSAESGIPTYRGTGGVWTKFGEPTIDGWDLFNEDPGQWWREALSRPNQLSDFSRAIDAAEPNAGHLAMADLEQMGRLKHIITQNIDNLHQRAGSLAVTEIHGNRFKARCLNCGQREPLARLSVETLPPLCQECGRCWEFCPAGAIGRGPVSFDYEGCIRCYCCIEVCPYGALHTVEPLAGRIARSIIQGKN